MISTNNMPTDFANYLWNKYRKSYILLQNDFNINEVDNNIILELQNQTFFKDFVWSEAKTFRSSVAH